MECERCYKEIVNEVDHGLNKCPLEARRAGFGVISDDIPGGLIIRHLDTDPIKCYSKTEIKRAANERGWVIDGDTPKAYSVSWSGKRKGEKEQ